MESSVGEAKSGPGLYQLNVVVLRQRRIDKLSQQGAYCRIGQWTGIARSFILLLMHGKVRYPLAMGS
jgi:hypothetical protein